MTVERTAVFGNHSTIEFRIRDTGIGIDKAFIPKIFDAFTQEDSRRSTKYGSTGLGMAITKSIVDLMNGTISVESEKGVGTEFTVVITLTNSQHESLASSYLDTKDMPRRSKPPTTSCRSASPGRTTTPGVWRRLRPSMTRSTTASAAQPPSTGNMSGRWVSPTLPPLQPRPTWTR
ncbi:MAG: hypothetical protein IKO07_09450 [Clostridia bacterium]|nr:hypothetical protein [Clostridia bacterium]